MLLLLNILLPCLLIFTRGEEHHLSSKLRAEQLERIRCGYDLKPLWTAEVAHSPFAATPLIADVDGDGTVDVVAVPFSESFTVLSGETGKTLKQSHWPSLNLDSSFHASPLQFDVDRDGLLDLLFTSSSGELLFYSASGKRLEKWHLQFPPVNVKRDWTQETLTALGVEMPKYVLDDHKANAKFESYIPVDPHVLATPVIADLNRDGRVEELVVALTYYFEEEDYREPEKLALVGLNNQTRLGDYLVAGVAVVNLTNQRIVWTKHIELTKILSAYPAFMLSSPTVIDLDSNGSPLEIVVGSSGGNIHIFNNNGISRSGYPSSFNTIHGQITVADLDSDESLEIITVDMSGIVRCTDSRDNLIWEGETFGDNSAGSRLVDVDHDGVLDVIVTSHLGDIYALNGNNGSVLPGWPFQVGHKIGANILVTKVSSVQDSADMVFIADDGNIYVMSFDLKCRAHFPIGETSLVQILSYDLVSQSEGIELLVSTNDGAIICLGSGIDQQDQFWNEDLHKAMLGFSVPAEMKSVNDFSFSPKKPSLYVSGKTRLLGEVTGNGFWIEMDIQYTPSTKNYEKYKPSLQVHFGSNLLYNDILDNPGLHAVYIPLWPHSCQGHMIITLTNQHGQVFQDGFALRFNKVILQDLQWLLLAPFIAMVIIILLLHGFPAKDLLPYTHQTKTR